MPNTASDSTTRRSHHSASSLPRPPAAAGPRARRPAAPSPALAPAMAGAVGLAALQPRNEAAARAAEAPAPPTGHYVVEVTEANFQAEVLDRSFQLPVVIEVRSL